MVVRKALLIALVFNILTSCVPATFIQIYKATPSSNKLINNEDRLMYEDDNCKVLYNLWTEGGNIGFSLYNKTDDDIFINMKESYFILNEMAHNYYKDRVYTDYKEVKVIPQQSFSFLKASYNNNSDIGGLRYSVSQNEEKVVCVPSKSFKIIEEYNISKSLFRDCDLYKYPTKKQIRVKRFSKVESPFVFSNRIAYHIGMSQDLIKFENEFYISEIGNYPESMLYTLKSVDFCDQNNKVLMNKAKAADKFYIKYKKQGYEDTKH